MGFRLINSLIETFLQEFFLCRRINQARRHQPPQLPSLVSLLPPNPSNNFSLTSNSSSTILAIQPTLECRSNSSSRSTQQLHHLNLQSSSRCLSQLRLRDLNNQACHQQACLRNSINTPECSSHKLLDNSNPKECRVLILLTLVRGSINNSPLQAPVISKGLLGSLRVSLRPWPWDSSASRCQDLRAPWATILMAWVRDSGRVILRLRATDKRAELWKNYPVWFKSSNNNDCLNIKVL